MALTPEQRRQRARRTNLLMAYAYAAASTKGWTPAQLATGASVWAWYDFSDLSTMFQDTAGTIPVTAAGQPIGRINDKSGNGYNATQSTAAARPIYQIDGSGRGYALFDGTDDSLATGTITPGAVDKAQMFAGVRKLSDAATGIAAEYTSSWAANTGSMIFAAPETAGVDQYGLGARGAAAFNVNQRVLITGYAAPITNVVTATHDIAGDLTIARVNGAQIGTAVGDKGAGGFADAVLNIGSRAGSLRFNGWIYGLIVRFSATNLDAATIANAETWMNGKTGAF